ncbi:MAG: exonuclease domain-containing protein, partial [Gammaproteobacteria bacterium]
MNNVKSDINKRFRGYLPVIIDVETGGFNPTTDALLEIAVVTVAMTAQGLLEIDTSLRFHITPFHGSNIDTAALEFNKID